LRAIVSLSLLAAATTWAFVQGQSQFDLRSLVLLGVMLAASVVALMGWLKSPSGCLQWDGQHWHWSGFEKFQACNVSLQMDFQNVVLVAIRGNAQRPIWLWLEAMPGDLTWKPLRRAIVSSQGISGDEIAADALAHTGEPR